MSRPANCAFHLRTLAKYGFVREAGGGRGRERPWTLANRNMTITHEPAGPAGRPGRRRTRPGSGLSGGSTGPGGAYGSRNELPGWEEASGWSSSHVFLTPEETTRLRDEMRRLLKRYEDRLTDPALRPEGALPVEWTIFAAPVPELRRARRGPGPDDRGAGRPAGPAARAPTIVNNEIYLDSIERNAIHLKCARTAFPPGARDHRRSLPCTRNCSLPGRRAPPRPGRRHDRRVRAPSARARPARAPRVTLPRFRVSWTRTTLAAVAGSRRGRSLVIVISATRTL